MKARRWIVGFAAAASLFGTWTAVSYVMQAGATFVFPYGDDQGWGKGLGDFLGFICGLLLYNAVLTRAKRKQ